MRVFIKHISQMPAVQRLYMKYPKEFSKAQWTVNVTFSAERYKLYHLATKPTKKQLRKLIKQVK